MATIFDGTCAFGSKGPYSAGVARDSAEFLAEFLGTLLFAYFGSITGTGLGAIGNGAALAVLVYCTAAVSGGKLNPAVSLAAALATKGSSASASLAKMLYEWVAQLTGAMAGVALVRSMTPDMGTGGVGCFAPSPLITYSQAASLEAFSTFLLVSTVLAVAVEPTANARFGPVAPLAIGLSLYVAASTAGSWTGGCLNPARFIGSAAAGGCSQPWASTWAYLLGEFAGAIVAAGVHSARDSLRASVLGAACALPPRQPAGPGSSRPQVSNLHAGSMHGKVSPPLMDGIYLR